MRLLILHDLFRVREEKDVTGRDNAVNLTRLFPP